MSMIARVEIARSGLGNSLYSFGDRVLKMLSSLRMCARLLSNVTTTLTYDESRTIDDIPEVWERVTFGLPR